jgi:hypothetical protein
MRKLTIIVSVCFLFYRTEAQEILSLPNDLVTLDETKVTTGITKLHTFLEHIHESKKLATISAAGFSYSTSKWPKGSWGNGYFTDDYEILAYEKQADSLEGYNIWFADTLGYNGSRPMIRDAGRIITSYINLFGTGVLSDTEIKERITWGVKFLLDDQLTVNVGSHNENQMGAFMWWGSRPTEFTPNSGSSSEITEWRKTRPEQFDSGFALEALTGAYFFFKKNGIDNPLFTLADIYNSIDKAAIWMTQHSYNQDWYYGDTCFKRDYDRNTNQVTCSVWGLLNAYKVTKKTAYLTAAIDAFERSVNFHQLADGAWYHHNCGKGKEVYDYHDSQGHYTGIILRNMVELYDQIFCEYQSKIGVTNSKLNLRAKILSTVNHFLKPGMSLYTDNGGVRLRQDGEIADYKAYIEQDNDVELEMFDALIYLQRSSLYQELSTSDKLKIDKMIPAILAPGLDQLVLHDKIGPYAALFRSVSYYRRSKNITTSLATSKVVLYSPNGDNIDDNKIGIYNIGSDEQIGYSNVGGYFDLMTTGDFDHDGDDEIAMYTRADGRIAIFNSGYNAYTGCNPVYVGSIYTQFKLHDLMEALDYDGDGYKDEIVMYNQYYAGRYNRIDILDINGYISSGYSNAGNTFKLMTTGDFDKDGKDEVALYTNSNGQIYIYNPDQATSNGITAYTASSPVYSGSIYTQFALHDMMEALDYDNDGFRDEVVMYNKYYGGSYNRIDVLDIGGYISSRYSNAGSTFGALATGDFDSDGRDEIAFYSNSDGQVSVYNPEHSTSMAYIGSPPIYAAGIYTHTTNYTMMSLLEAKTKDNLQASARHSKNVDLDEKLDENDPALRNFIMYPNPVFHELNIEYKTLQNCNVKIYVTNLMGQETENIENTNRQAGFHKIQHVTNSKPGIYYLHFKIDGRIVRTQKVIVEK